VQYIDAFLRTRYPDRHFELINLGLSSETVTGLSEPDHPFPRPDVHERIDRALARTKPSVVVMCYGMNDGIYYPFSEDRFAKYKSSVHEMIDRVQKASAKVILMTPPPFDAGAMAGHLLPASAPKFSYAQPYADYDSTLKRYAEWLLSLRSRSQVVVELHRATWDFINAARKTTPGYHLAPDGVHPTPDGHAIIARQFLEALQAPAVADIVDIDAATSETKSPRVKEVLVTPEEIRFKWLANVPMPSDPAWTPAVRGHAGLERKLNRYQLIVRHAPADRYRVYEGDKLLGEVTRIELEQGFDLLRLPDLSTNKRALEILNLVRKRERLLSAAWLSDVGHKRPDVPPGLPLAEAQAQAVPMEEELRRLVQPVEVVVRLVPSS
jgi:lysophospholipase L1-like esterase